MDPNRDPQKNPLTDIESLEQTIQMFRNQLEGTKKGREQLKAQIQKFDETVADLEKKLESLLKYHDFVSVKGFAGIKQWMDSHQEEIKQAELERIVEEEKKRYEPSTDEEFNFDFSQEQTTTT